MPKTFYTEYEIEDAHRRGVTSLEVNDNVVLTDLALERALKLGIQLKRVQASALPVAQAAGDGDLHQRVKAAVLARLIPPVDTALVDAVISKVLNALK